jgi:hypothetical protein
MAATDAQSGSDGAHGRLMMLGESDGRKGCAARTGKPASALDPLALTQRLAVMPFRARCVPRQGSIMSTGRAVTFLTGRNCDFSNGDRHCGDGEQTLPYIVCAHGFRADRGH